MELPLHNAAAARRATRLTMSFLTSSTGIGPLPPGATDTAELDLLGLDIATRRVLWLRHQCDGSGAPPRLLAMHVGGAHSGRLIDGGPGAASETELHALRTRLVPLTALPARELVVSTRVVRRRAERVVGALRPVRKYTVRVTVAPRVPSAGAMIGRVDVAAYLRPRVQLSAAWRIPGHGLVLAEVGYIGAPVGPGAVAHAAILLRA